MSEVTLKTKAIILRRESFLENDSRVLVYTADFGRLDLIARGTQKMSSKLAAHLEPLNLTEIMIIKGKQYDYLGSAISEEIFSDIKNDLDKIKIAGQSINILNNLIKETHPDKDIFELLKNTLDFINKSDLTEFNWQRQVFTLKLISLLGHQPEVHRCVACGKNLPAGNNKFSFNLGGIICSQCVEAGSIRISDQAIEILKLILERDISDTKILDINLDEVENIIEKFRIYYFG